MEVQSEGTRTNQIIASQPLVIITPGGRILLSEIRQYAQDVHDLERTMEAMEGSGSGGTITSTTDEPAPGMASG